MSIFLLQKQIRITQRSIFFMALRSAGRNVALRRFELVRAMLTDHPRRFRAKGRRVCEFDPATERVCRIGTAQPNVAS